MAVLSKLIKEMTEKMDMLKAKENVKVPPKVEIDETAIVMTLKGYDAKNIKKPPEWAGEKEEYTIWKVLFTAYLGTFDQIWKEIAAKSFEFNEGKFLGNKLIETEIDDFLLKKNIPGAET